MFHETHTRLDELRRRVVELAPADAIEYAEVHEFGKSHTVRKIGVRPPATSLPGPGDRVRK